MIFHYLLLNILLNFLKCSNIRFLLAPCLLYKYLYLVKIYLIDCEFNNKFKKWIPINLSKNKLIEKKELLLILEKKKSLFNI